MALHAILQPLLLLRILDVHVLGADGIAVRGAEAIEDLTQRLERLHVGGDGAAGRLDRTRKEGTIEVPDREAVGGGIQLFVVARLAAQRVGVGDEVAADAISVDQLNHRRFLCHIRIHRPVTLGRDVLIGLPLNGQIRDPQIAKHAVVEAFISLQQLLHGGEKRAGFRALDDAMVVSAADHQHLAQPEHVADLLAGGSEFGRIVDGAGRDDCPLAGHQARNGAERADGAGVGQGNGGAFEIGDLELIVASARRRRRKRRRTGRSPCHRRS